MNTFADVIDRFGGAARMAGEIHEEANTIRQWASRDSIDARYWKKIIAAARRLGIRGINSNVLTELASRRMAA